MGGQRVGAEEQKARAACRGRPRRLFGAGGLQCDAEMRWWVAVVSATGIDVLAARLDVSPPPKDLERGAALYLCSHTASVHLARTSTTASHTHTHTAPKRQREQAALAAAAPAPSSSPVWREDGSTASSAAPSACTAVRTPTQAQAQLSTGTASLPRRTDRPCPRPRPRPRWNKVHGEQGVRSGWRGAVPCHKSSKCTRCHRLVATHARPCM